MALVATVGASTSNSYATLLESDAHFQLGMHPNALKWQDQKAEEKEAYLIEATRMVDQCQINGAKYTTTSTSGVADQALKFPRGEDYDDSTTFIPSDVKNATMEQALWLCTLGVQNRREQLQSQGVVSASIGDVSETYSGRAAADPLTRLCPAARSYLTSGGFIRRHGRLAP